MEGHAGRAAAAGGPCRADRIGELRQPAGHAGAGVGADQQVCRRLPVQALLRWLRARRRGRAAGHRSGQGAVRRRVRQRAAALRLAGQCGRLHGDAAARRHDPRHVPGPRRPPDPRCQRQLQRQALQERCLRPRARDRDPRLRPGRRAGSGTQAEDDRRRRLGLLAGDRLGAAARYRRPCRRLPAGGHGALLRPDRRRRVPEPGGHRPLRHEHHPQDAARPARRHHPVAVRVREAAELDDLPRHPGRSADARHRGQGAGLQGSDVARIQDLPEAGQGQRQGDGAAADRARPAHRLRRHREPPVPARPARQEDHRQGRRSGARPGAHDGQQERDPERSREALSSPAASGSARRR